MAAGIAGFWFGSRGSGFPERTQLNTPEPKDDDDVFIGPEIGDDRYGRRANLDDDNSPQLERD
ncbi:hypothetical protein AIOL_004487 [Candidatus Rhodobacter oscarellae]|uniref:Uncharacterized protein n=1 Tax=Candidatus Rhodobacter oscarellae TaxID=1675527 RepID=A0A0J9E9P4_9RHOB|nr:hypothetical protein AIOL_004487 [Candidatus Rhodobacter lobularis]